MKSKVLIDNSTLTAVQRLLGDIVIKNKSTIDGDILALENLIQCILLYDEIKFVDDYKESHRKSRNKRFDFIDKLEIDQINYKKLISLAKKSHKDIHIKKGKFQGEMKDIMESLKMNMIFTWDIQSSEYFLWGKMLTGSESSLKDEEQFKQQMALMMNQCRSSGTSGLPFMLEGKNSKGQKIKKSLSMKNSNQETEEQISDQTQLLINSLSWISLRTKFYLMTAKKENTDLFLHPIRNAFHINVLEQSSSETYTFQFIKEELNGTIKNTYKEITKSNRFKCGLLKLPIFSAWIISKVSSPEEIIPYALDLKSRKDFKRLREILFRLKENNFDLKQSNKFGLDIKNSLSKIEEEYCIRNNQGKLLSSIAFAFDLFTKNYSSLLIKGLGLIESPLRQTTTGHLFRSITKDLLSVSKMGDLHEKITSNVRLDDKEAYDQYIKTEEERYFKYSSDWKKLM